MGAHGGGRKKRETDRFAAISHCLAGLSMWHHGMKRCKSRVNPPSQLPAPSDATACRISSAAEPRPTGEPLLEIRGLKTHFKTDDGMVRAVDGVDLFIDRGETLGVVGESGCGKTVTAMTVLKLIQMPPGTIVEGQVLWQGRDLVPLEPGARCGRSAPRRSR